MRLLWIAILTVALPAVAVPACNSDSCDRAWLNAHIHLNQMQMVGTAESYKLAPSDAVLSVVRMGGKKDAEALDFGEPALSAQLDAGARSLSFDVAYDPKGGLFKNPAIASMASELLDPGYVSAMAAPGFKVIHVLDVDYRSTCLTLRDCLEQVADWSRAHKHHAPIIIALHTNDARTPMPGATKPVAFDSAAFAALDDEIRSVFKAAEIITPDQVKASHASLRDAVLAGSWPTLGQARGKVLFVLEDTAPKVDLYAGPAHALDGRPMFVTADETSPVAAIIAIDDPVKDAGRIAKDVHAGFLVVTRADDGTVEARASNLQRRDQAFASGAQIVQTNFLIPDKKIGAYQVSAASQCSGRRTADFCFGENAPAQLIAAVNAH